MERLYLDENDIKTIYLKLKTNTKYKFGKTPNDERTGIFVRSSKWMVDEKTREQFDFSRISWIELEPMGYAIENQKELEKKGNSGKQVKDLKAKELADFKKILDSYQNKWKGK